MKEGTLPTAAAGLLVAAPAVAAGFYVHLFGVDVPYFDEWDEMRHVIALHEKKLGFSDLISPHNEHHLFFPRLFMIALARATNYNLRAFMFASVITLCSTVALLLVVHLRAQRARQRNLLFSLLTFVPVACLELTFRQTDNLLFGIQISVFSSLFFFVLAMVMLEEARGLDLRFIAALASATISSFSFGSGLLVFPIGLIQLYLRSRAQIERKSLTSREFRKRAIVWLIAGGVVVTFYAASFYRPVAMAAGSSALRHPIGALLQFVAFIGNPFATEIYPALAFGTITLCLYCAVCTLLIIQGVDRYTSVMLSLVLFSLFAGAMIALGRSQFGTSAGLAPRYVTLSVPGVCGLYMMILTLNASFLRSALLGVLTGMIAVGTMTSYPQGIFAGRFWSSERRASAHYLRTYRQQPDEHLATLFPQLDRVKPRISALEKYQLSLFRHGNLEHPQASESQTRFKIEKINRKSLDDSTRANIRYTETVLVEGWAIDLPNQETAAGVFLVTDGKNEVAAKYGIMSLKSAQLFGSARYLYSGFSGELPASTISRGVHFLGLKIVSADGRWFYSTPAVEIVIE